jgi:hypothetical protein
MLRKAVVVILLALTLGTMPLRAAQDLYIRDTPLDTGIEPDPDPSWMFLSDDIWVRTSPDPGYQPYAFPQGSPPWTPLPHENPEYRDPKYSVPNYVYVRVRNRGSSPSTGTERLRVYWTKASTGTGWPSAPRVCRRAATVEAASRSASMRVDEGFDRPAETTALIIDSSAGGANPVSRLFVMSCA